MSQAHATGQSLWTATHPVPDRPPLTADVMTEICVIGGGIAGLTTAYLLAKEGRSVALLERGRLGCGMTAFTTAHLSTALDDRYALLEELHGEDGARLAASSHGAAVTRIEDIVREERIDCDFVRLDGYLFAPPDDSPDALDRELAAAHRAGLTGVEKIDRAPIDAFDTGPALRFPQQAQCHPLKYLDGLARAFERLGGTLYCHSPATDIRGGKSLRVEGANGHSVCARHVVVATNAPFNDRVVVHAVQAPYTTYVIGLVVPANDVAPALYWDTGRHGADSAPAPYHYVRLVDTGQDGAAAKVLLVGGEDHKSGQAADGDARFRKLAAWARERWPTLGEECYRWSGQVMEPADGMAFIGHNPLDDEHVYVVSGDSGNGMTHGTLAGMLLTDLIAGRENPWAKLYHPDRFKLKATPRIMRENANVALQFAKGYLDLELLPAAKNIERGQGAIVRNGLVKIAVFRDEDGSLVRMSAQCPHLGCLVAWNSVQRTWDCPCHGSKFDRYGRVVNGPADRHLRAATEAGAWPRRAED